MTINYVLSWLVNHMKGNHNKIRWYRDLDNGGLFTEINGVTLRLLGGQTESTRLVFTKGVRTYQIEKPIKRSSVALINWIRNASPVDEIKKDEEDLCKKFEELTTLALKQVERRDIFAEKREVADSLFSLVVSWKA